MKKTVALLLMLFTAFSVSGTVINAAGKTDGSITIECGEAEVVWNLYLTGVPDSSGNIETCGDFSILDFPGVTKYDEKYFIFSGVLADFVREHGITPEKTAVSDGNGRVVFTGLTEGFYEAVPEILKKDNVYFISSPVAVFAGDSEEPQRRDIVVESKSRTEIVSHDNPDEWIIEFRYDDTRRWDNYIKFQDITWITSEPSGSPEVTDVTFPDCTPSAAVTDEYITTDTSVSTDNSVIITTEKLPQTGQIWLPVPVLSACGMLLLVLGAVVKRNS